MSDHQDAIYRNVETMVKPILESNAKRFARQLDMTFAEALQEARYGLMLALRKYDYNDSRGGIFNFAKTAVRRHFLKVWAVQSAQSRRPHVHVVQDDGSRCTLPVPFLDQGKHYNVPKSLSAHQYSPVDFMDSFESTLSRPDAPIVEKEVSDTATAFRSALEHSLSDRDRDVLRCKIDPPRGLVMLMLDELAVEPTIPLIGRYLNLSKNEVDWAIRRIRDAALELVTRDFSDLADLAIVRSYVERRP